MTLPDSVTPETPRLRPYRADDFESCATMWAEPEIVRFIGGKPMSREVALTRFLRQIGIRASRPTRRRPITAIR